MNGVALIKEIIMSNKWTSLQNHLFGYLDGLVPTRVISTVIDKSPGAIRSKRRRYSLLSMPFSRERMPWTTPEIIAAQTLRFNNVSYKHIANRLGRTTKAIRRFIEKH